MKRSFPFRKQNQPFDCGVTCLAMISSYYKKPVGDGLIEQLRLSYDRRLSFFDLREIGKIMNLNVVGVKASFEELSSIIPLPCIVHWNESHFVVVFEINDHKIYVADPAHGIAAIDKSTFMHNWLSTEDKGYVLALEAL